MDHFPPVSIFESLICVLPLESHLHLVSMSWGICGWVGGWKLAWNYFHYFPSNDFFIPLSKMGQVIGRSGEGQGHKSIYMGALINCILGRPRPRTGSCYLVVSLWAEAPVVGLIGLHVDQKPRMTLRQLPRLFTWLIARELLMTETILNSHNDLRLLNSLRDGGLQLIFKFETLIRVNDDGKTPFHSVTFQRTCGECHLSSIWTSIQPWLLLALGAKSRSIGLR